MPATYDPVGDLYDRLTGNITIRRNDGSQAPGFPAAQTVITGDETGVSGQPNPLYGQQAVDPVGDLYDRLTGKEPTYDFSHNLDTQVAANNPAVGPLHFDIPPSPLAPPGSPPPVAAPGMAPPEVPGIYSGLSVTQGLDNLPPAGPSPIAPPQHAPINPVDAAQLERQRFEDQYIPQSLQPIPDPSTISDDRGRVQWQQRVNEARRTLGAEAQGMDDAQVTAAYNAATTEARRQIITHAVRSVLGDSPAAGAMTPDEAMAVYERNPGQYAPIIQKMMLPLLAQEAQDRITARNMIPADQQGVTPLGQEAADQALLDQLAHSRQAQWGKDHPYQAFAETAANSALLGIPQGLSALASDTTIEGNLAGYAQEHPYLSTLANIGGFFIPGTPAAKLAEGLGKIGGAAIGRAAGRGVESLAGRMLGKEAEGLVGRGTAEQIPEQTIGRRVGKFLMDRGASMAAGGARGAAEVPVFSATTEALSGNPKEALKNLNPTQPEFWAGVIGGAAFGAGTDALRQLFARPIEKLAFLKPAPEVKASIDRANAAQKLMDKKGISPAESALQTGATQADFDARAKFKADQASYSKAVKVWSLIKRGRTFPEAMQEAGAAAEDLAVAAQMRQGFKKGVGSPVTVERGESISPEQSQSPGGATETARGGVPEPSSVPEPFRPIQTPPEGTQAAPAGVEGAAPRQKLLPEAPRAAEAPQTPTGPKPPENAAGIASEAKKPPVSTGPKPQPGNKYAQSDPRYFKQKEALKRTKLVKGAVVHGGIAQDLEQIAAGGITPSGLSGRVDAERLGDDGRSRTAAGYAGKGGKGDPVLIVLKNSVETIPSDGGAGAVEVNSRGANHIRPEDIAGVIFGDGTRVKGIEAALSHWRATEGSGQKAVSREELPTANGQPPTGQEQAIIDAIADMDGLIQGATGKKKTQLKDKQDILRQMLAQARGGRTITTEAQSGQIRQEGVGQEPRSGGVEKAGGEGGRPGQGDKETGRQETEDRRHGGTEARRHEGEEKLPPRPSPASGRGGIGSAENALPGGAAGLDEPKRPASAGASAGPGKPGAAGSPGDAGELRPARAAAAGKERPQPGGGRETDAGENPPQPGRRAPAEQRPQPPVGGGTEGVRGVGGEASGREGVGDLNAADDKTLVAAAKAIDAGNATELASALKEARRVAAGGKLAGVEPDAQQRRIAEEIAEELRGKLRSLAAGGRRKGGKTERARVRDELGTARDQSGAKLTDEQIDAGMALAEAHAAAWSRISGRPAEQWFERVSATTEAPGAGAMAQPTEPTAEQQKQMERGAKAVGLMLKNHFGTPDAMTVSGLGPVSFAVGRKGVEGLADIQDRYGDAALEKLPPLVAMGDVSDLPNDTKMVRLAGDAAILKPIDRNGKKGWMVADFRPEAGSDLGREGRRREAERWTQDIQAYVDGALPTYRVPEIGLPSPLLRRAGVPDRIIEVRQSVLDKSGEKHKLGKSELLDLRNAVLHPIMVFKPLLQGNGLGVLTEIKHGGRNVLASIRVNVTRDRVLVNDISTIHPKQTSHVLDWINRDLLLAADRKKAEAWLEDSSSGNWRKQQTTLLQKIIGASEPPVNPDTLYQDDADAPTWYSPLRRLIEAKMPNKAAPLQIRGIIAKGSVKADELKWTGLDDWLAERKGPVSKAEVLAFLDAHAVRVEEVTKGEAANETTRMLHAQFVRAEDALISAARRDGVDRDFYVEVADHGQIPRLPENVQPLAREYRRVQDEMEAADESGEMRDGRYADFTLPGGENYTELLLTLPGEMGYESPHFAEPNILAHVRFDERTDADGKRVLFIEEVQSDWHQAGREKGYRAPEAASELRVTRRPDGSWYAMSERHVRVWGTGDSREEAIREAMGRSDAIPPAPFSKTWHELAMKRMIRWAAEHGYDRIAWTTGDQQARRYDLAQHVDRLAVDRTPGGYTLRAVTESTTRDRSQTLASGVPADKLAEYVGEDLAEKINAGPDQQFYSGLDLRVGGEGMREFYDRILPRFMTKYGKKWGAKVGETRIKAGRKIETVHSIDITPAMKKSVLEEGQPLFQGKAKGAITFVDDGRALIHILENADASTIPHELAHLFTKDLQRLAAETDDTQLAADLATLESWAGVKDGQWKRENHEKVARGFERWLREGKSPIAALRRVFERFKAWLTDLYRSVKGSAIDVEVTPAAQGVFERWLGGEGKARRQGDLETGRRAAGASAEWTPPKPIEAIGGRETNIQTAGEPVPAHYALVEADSLIPSHDPATFRANPAYPPDIQERQYDRDKEEQQKVQRQIRNFDPAFVLTDNPDPVNGPPMILPNGLVMGGNSRAMTMSRVYAAVGSGEEGTKGKALRDATLKAAQRFGIDVEAAKDMKAPVLVRMIDTGGESVPPARMRRWVRDLQKGRTQEMTAGADAVSRARVLLDHPESLERLDGILGDGDSVREAMSDPKKIVRIRQWLETSGVLTPSEINRFTHPETGQLSEDGKRLVERVLLGTILPDPDLLDGVPQVQVNKLAGNLAGLVIGKTRGAEWDLSDDLTKAITAWHKWKASGLSLAEYTGGGGQQTLIPRPILEQPRANVLLNRWADESAAKFRERVKMYGAIVRDFEPEQQWLGFTRPPTANEAFEAAFGQDEPSADAGPKMSVREMLGGEPTTLFQGGDEPAEPVKITGDELGTGPLFEMRRRARKWADENIAGRTVTNESDGTEILIPRSGIKSSLERGSGLQKILSTVALPRLLETGVKAGVEADRKGRKEIKAVHLYDAKLVIGDKPYDVRLVVRETNEGKRFYDHELSKISEPAGTSGESTLSGRSSAQPTAGSDTSIPQEPGQVKPEDEEPRTLYQETGPEAVRFANDESEERFQEAKKGIQELPLSQRVKNGIIEQIHLATRPFPLLPVNRANAEAKRILLQLQKEKGIAAQDTKNVLKTILTRADGKVLDADQYDLFTRKVILDDLAEEVERQKARIDDADNEGGGQPVEVRLPFAFTPETVASEKAKIDGLVAKDEDVRRALDRRRDLWRAIVRERIDAAKAAGVKLDNKLTRKDYFRHQILMYAQEAATARGSGERLEVANKRGYLKARHGSELDINANYAQAEFSVMHQFLYDTKIDQAVAGIGKHYDVLNELKARAAEANAGAVMDLFRDMAKGLGLKGEDAEAWAAKARNKELNVKQAIGFDKLYKLAADDALPDTPDGKWQSLIDAMADVRVFNSANALEIAEGKVERRQLSSSQFKQLMAYGGWVMKLVDDTGFADPAKVAVGTIFKGMAEKRSKVKQMLADRGGQAEWRDFIPEGYVEWQPRPGSSLFAAYSIPEKMATDLLSGALEELGLTKKDVRKVLAKGSPFTPFVIPEELAKTLDQIAYAKSQDPFEQWYVEFSGKTLNTWKQYILMNPRTVIKYNLRNLTGDLDAVIAANPDSLRYVPQAWRELFAAMVKGEKMTSLMTGWYQRGGMEATQVAQEIKDLHMDDFFKNFDPNKTSKTMLRRLIGAWWTTAGKYTGLREAVLRYATYLSYEAQIMKNADGLPNNYGASIPEEVKGLHNVKDRAWLLSNEALGAYDSLGQTGMAVRRHLIPFWSWNETSLKRTIRLIHNAYRDDDTAQRVGQTWWGRHKKTRLGVVGSIKLGKLLLAMSATWIASSLYNHVFHSEAENDLPPDVQRRAHIILYQKADGTVVYFDRIGLFADVYNWFMNDDPFTVYDEYMSGRRSLGQVLLGIGQAAPNKLITGLRPGLTIPYSLLSGKTLWPNAFDPRTIHDKWEWTARQFNLQDEFDVVANRPHRPYLKNWGGALVYQRNPGASAYYQIVDRKQQFLQSIGKGADGATITPRGEALLQYKRALKFDDKRAAEKYLGEYLSLGGTKAGMERSLHNMDPFSGLKTWERWQFYSWLPEEDRRRIDQAYAYYENVLNATPDREFDPLFARDPQGWKPLKKLAKADQDYKDLNWQMNKLVELAGGDKYHGPTFTPDQQKQYDDLFKQRNDVKAAHETMSQVKKLYKDIQAAERRENPDWVWIDRQQKRMKAMAEGAVK